SSISDVFGYIVSTQPHGGRLKPVVGLLHSNYRLGKEFFSPSLKGRVIVLRFHVSGDPPGIPLLPSMVVFAKYRTPGSGMIVRCIDQDMTGIDIQPLGNSFSDFITGRLPHIHKLPV